MNAVTCSPCTGVDLASSSGMQPAPPIEVLWRMACADGAILSAMLLPVAHGVAVVLHRDTTLLDVEEFVTEATARRRAAQIAAQLRLPLLTLH